MSMFHVNSAVNLNFSRPNRQKIYAVKGDTVTRQIQAALYDGSAPRVVADYQGTQLFNNCIIIYELPDGSSGWYYFTDGYDQTISPMTQTPPTGNTVWFVLRPPMVAQAGTVKVWVCFNGSSGTGELDFLRTFPFEIEVADCPYFNPEDPDYDPLAPEGGE